MRRRGIISSLLIVILFLMFLGLITNVTLENDANAILENDTNGVDLNTLMFTQFQEWDSALTRWASVNGSLSDPYDRAQAVRTDPKATLCGMGSLIPWISFYQATGDEYYLRKLQFFVDRMIEEPWFRRISDIGEIYYVPAYWYDGSERDTSGMKTMWFATAAVRLYQWTGLLKYKQLADDVASQSLKLAVVNNATDVSWSWAYYLFRDLTNARIGVNRQGSMALFYSVYGSVMNSTFSEYVPKIVNWMWRAQLSGGGLAYSIGVSSPDIAYSAFSLAKVLYAYQYAPNEFSVELKTKMNSTLMWLRTGVHGGNNFNYNNIYIIASAYVRAVKTGFYTPTQSFLDTTGTVIYTALQMINIRERGHVTTFDDYAFGFRWAEYFNSYFFSVYPLPPNLQTYSQSIFAYEQLTPSKVKLIGAGFQYIYGIQYRYGDLNLVSGMHRQSYITTFVAYKSGTYARSVTAEYGYLKAWANSTSPGLKILQYWYPSYTTFANVTGNGSPRIVTSAADSILRVDNGTVFNLSTMSNGTKVLSNCFMVAKNFTHLEKETHFIYTPNTDRWNFTRSESLIILESTSLSDYQITTMGLSSWKLFGDNITKVFNTMKNFVIAHHSLTPISYDAQISLWIAELNKVTSPCTWLDTYQSSTTTAVRLIAHSNPEKVLLEAWAYKPKMLTFTIDTSLETTSTFKIYCSGDRKPGSVWVGNGTVVWSYSSSTNILTLNVTHSGRADISVDWRILGDVNADDIVDVRDLARVGRAYGSSPEQLAWDSEADLNKDSIINALDSSIVSGNYGRVRAQGGTLGDVNGDGVVDVNDLRKIKTAYGSKPEEPTWDTKADLNRDNIISCHDLFIVGKHYGNTES